MIKRFTALLLIIVLLLSLGSTSLACDEKQTSDYTSQILFGNRAYTKSSTDNYKMLVAGLYLCSVQADNQGQDKIDYLKIKRVSGLPTLSELNIQNSALMECSHNKWEYVSSGNRKSQENRKKALRNTVNKVFDFGFFNNLFSSKGKCDSFAALLYYSHILADYLADDPSETEVVVDGKLIPAFSGTAYSIINGDRPKFSSVDKSRAEFNTYLYDGLDSNGRAKTVLAVVGPMTLEEASQDSIQSIKPAGWKQNSYERISGSHSAELYNRSHLLARSMGGENLEENLVTGTAYLNQTGMKELEEKVLRYIKNTNNNVLYRVTPVYKRDNKVCSGIQLEAFSLEDSGEGICFNRYFYNVQPGIKINYATGDSWQSDNITNARNTLPFAVSNPSENNPDLIYELNKHIAILFDDQKGSDTYNKLIRETQTAGNKARGLANSDINVGGVYIEMNKYKYEYLKALTDNVPRLLEKEEYFKKAFK